MRLSIIVPIYKVEKYLSKCLNSLLDQDLDSSEYEIICINDGSPDNCKTIVLEYQQKNSNIVFIDQENQGVSVARNQGLEIAKGDYVLFIDPDDSIFENSLASVVEIADKNDLDVLYLPLELYDESDQFLYLYEPCGKEGEVKDGISHPRRTFPATLYKRNVIGNIRFIKGITRGQDSVFNAMVQSLANRCSYGSIPYYKYLQRETSSRQYVGNDNAFNGCLIAIKELDNFKNQFFPNPTQAEEEYFDTVKLIFLKVLIEWSLLSGFDRNRFKKVKIFLDQNNQTYLADNVSIKFKFFNKSYYMFMGYYFSIKKIHSFLALLSKLKRKLFN